jgi:hypothetical protein
MSLNSRPAVERGYGQQLDRADAEVLQIRNLVDDSRIGAAPPERNGRVGLARKCPDVHLVDDGLGKRSEQGAPCLHRRRSALPV